VLARTVLSSVIAETRPPQILTHHTAGTYVK